MRDTDQPKNAESSDSATPLKTTVFVPVIEESLVVGKRLVDHGGYRIVKNVSVREEVVDEAMTTHTVHIERRPIGQLLPSLDAPVSRQEGDTLIISVVDEVLVTERRLMLKEELRITRTQTVTHQPRKFSLRSEEIAIERLEPGVPPPTGTP